MNSLKKILIVLMIGLLVIPFNIRAEEKKYNTLNFDEALKEEEIEHDFSNYSESDDQIIIYLFRGKGCAYCRKFLNFLNSIVDEYGKYFKVVSYEVWYDSDNAKLMSDISKFKGEEAGGVPYIIIGDKVFAGYTETYDDSIKEAITNLYNTKKSERYDVMEDFERNSGNGATTQDESSYFSIIIINVIISLMIGIVVCIVDSKKRVELEDRIDELEKVVNKTKKVKNEK